MTSCKSILFTLLATCAVLALPGQSLEEDPAITRLMEEFVEYNITHTEIRGWRIQVLSTTDRRTMESTQARFNRIYPEFELDFEHRNPFYNLKTGAFLTQQDARPMLRMLQKVFPGAFMVTDKFEISEVLKYRVTERK